MENVEETLKQLESNLSQSEAAILIVFSAHVRRRMEKRAQENNDADVIDLLRALETCGMESIQVNDGEFAYWVGVASKQLNPLLM